MDAFAAAIDALFARWEVPEPGEAHELVQVLDA